MNRINQKLQENKKLLSILVCPVCKGELEYLAKDDELICHQDNLAYPIREKIPVLIESDARKLTVS